MRKLSMTMAVIATFASAALAAEPGLKITPGKGSLAATSKYLDAKISLLRPQFSRLSVDSLGQGKFRTGTLQPSPAAAGARENDVRRTDSGVEYRGKGIAASTPARWTIRFDAAGFTLISRWSQADPPEPIVLEFNPKQSRATLLGTATFSASCLARPAESGCVRLQPSR